MMIGQHSLILLDEVLSGLDNQIKMKAIAKIKEKSKDKIVVIISHDSEIHKLCDYIFVISNIIMQNNYI